jgi:hypothetical protein
MGGTSGFRPYIGPCAGFARGGRVGNPRVTDV